MVDSRSRFPQTANFSYRCSDLIVCIVLRRAVESASRIDRNRFNRSNRVSAKNGIALYLYLEETGQTSESRTVQSRSANLVVSVQCLNTE